jgi:hypothetical protein
MRIELYSSSKTGTMDHSRSDATFLITFIAKKETDYGTETVEGVPRNCGEGGRHQNAGCKPSCYNFEIALVDGSRLYVLSSNCASQRGASTLNGPSIARLGGDICDGQTVIPITADRRTPGSLDRGDEPYPWRDFQRRERASMPRGGGTAPHSPLKIWNGLIVSGEWPDFSGGTDGSSFAAIAKS